MDEDPQARIGKVIHEEISIVAYNPDWPAKFLKEAIFLKRRLPTHLIRRIEHFGSTAVPGLSAKPIIDILVEVASLENTKEFIVPIMISEKYEYFWRPVIGEQPPYYAWFIKRDSDGKRTHHIHMVEGDSELWDRLYFRDYLRRFPEEAQLYDRLKRSLSDRYPGDRVAYTMSKGDYIASVTARAKEYFIKSQ